QLCEISAQRAQTHPIRLGRAQGSVVSSSQRRSQPRQGYRRDAIPGGMSQPLEGRVPLVTGSTGAGMGRRTARTVAREAANDGRYQTIPRALPRFSRKRCGRVVNIGMERSEEFTEPPFDYTVGKIARHGLTRILSEVEIGRGITINAVAPGYIPYFTFRQALEAVHHRGLWASRRNGTPQDIAEVVTFLCSDEARNVTGAVIPVHGAPD